MDDDDVLEIGYGLDDLDPDEVQWIPPVSSDGVQWDVEDELRGRYESTMRRMTAVQEIQMRRHILVEQFQAVGPEATAWWIDQITRGALWGQQAEIDAALACALWLIHAQQHDMYGLLQGLFEAAHQTHREIVLFLLRDAPPHRQLKPGQRLPQVRLPMDRPVSVGERRSFARLSDRDIIDRLLLDPNPLVIRQLLENPHVLLQDILTIASRRPTLQDILVEIALHRRWIGRIEVREALVQNPFNRTGISLKFLPTLRIGELRRLRNAQTVHPSIPKAADLLVRLRERRTAPWRV